MTTIKVNGKTITITDKSTESFDIDKESKTLESLALNIEKSIEVFDIVSNIKAIESFGYKSAEGVGEKIKAGLKNIWKKIRDFFIKIGKFIKKIINAIRNISINAAFKKLSKQYDYDKKTIVKEYVHIIVNNQDSELGGRFKNVLNAQKLFGEDFGKKFDPIEDSVQSVRVFANYLDKSSKPASDLAEGFKEAADRTETILTKMKSVIKKEIVYVMFYNVDKLLTAALDDNAVNKIDSNVNTRVYELEKANDTIIKNVDIILKKAEMIDDHDEMSSEHFLKQNMNELAKNLTDIGNYTIKVIRMLNSIKPSILDFYKYLTNILKSSNEQN